jgi:DNA-binding MarR family transcriptional regulator
MTIISDALPPVRPASDLYEHLSFWQNRFNQIVHTALERRLGALNTTVSQWSLMALLYHREADTVSDIARLVDLDPGAVTRLADRLQKKGYLRRASDPADRRSVILSLTRAGRKLVPDLAAAADENDRDFFGVLNEEERDQFQALLGKLLRAAENPEGSGPEISADG